MDKEEIREKLEKALEGFNEDIKKDKRSLCAIGACDQEILKTALINLTMTFYS